MKKRDSIRLALSVIAILLALLPPGGVVAEPPTPHQMPAGAEPSSDVLRLIPDWAISASAASDLPDLNGAAVADAPYGSAPTVDGEIAPGEYAGAHRFAFPSYGGEMEVFLHQGEGALFIAFDSPDTTPYPLYAPEGRGPAFQVMLDVDRDGGTAPQMDDLRLTVDKGGRLAEEHGTGTEWEAVALPAGWDAAAYTATWGWQTEFVIPFAQLGIVPGTPISIGLGLAEVRTLDYPVETVWPVGGDTAVPSSWGTLVSSSDWSNFYWKPGPWEDYAPSGLPDFDQRQVADPGYDGPFAVANSLWWFDARLEGDPVGPVGSTMPISDTYPLVSPYGSWDDHDPDNVVPLALDLATSFSTDPMSGTEIYELYAGIQRYLRNRGLWDEYVVTLVERPSAEWIAQEVQRSEDVILLLGFWQDDDGWHRVGGHYVTVAGVGSEGGENDIALSDPAQDWAEEPTGSGRVLSGTLISHAPLSGHLEIVHNDAGNVSHDTYDFGEPSAARGSETLRDYVMPSLFSETLGLNPNPNWNEAPDYVAGVEVETEIEYALAISPYVWKASGRWVEDPGVSLYGRRFEPLADYAPSGVPDFDQRQDNWNTEVTGRDAWTYCGPVAMANSLWWFDSKFEYQGTPPPAISGTHPLVASYQPWYDVWDDHDPRNVDDSAGDEFVEDLANYMDTDGGLFDEHHGTIITDAREGLESYLIDRGMLGGYVITQAQAPDFWWVAEEVERSEDVILLLGFWQYHGDEWVRLGAHYVTVPGVDKQGGLVAFSDPYFDRVESALPPGEFVGAPQWTGRIGSDGDPPLGPSGLVPTYTHMVTHPGNYTLHNDAANVSHDVYRVIAAPAGLLGRWEPEGYVIDWMDVENFWGVNLSLASFPTPQPVPVHTVVDWALAVSPVADVTVRKYVDSPSALPGERVTFTIAFSNTGPLLAEDVVLGDTLPAQLRDVSVVGVWTSNGEPIVPRDGVSFTWDLPDLAWGDRGLITMTAQVDPELSWPASLTLTNWVTIATSTGEQTIGASNLASATLEVQTADVVVEKQVSDDVVMVGDWITYTIVFTSNGPAPAANVVLTDPIHSWLTNTRWEGWTFFSGTLSAQGRYVWDAGEFPIPAGERGQLWVSGLVSPPVGALGTLSNGIEIGTDTPESWTGNNTSSADVEVVEYGVAIDPSTGMGSGPPGSVVVHTLMVTNTGTYTDTYDIVGSVVGEPWETVWPSEVGPVSEGRSAQVVVQVEIPPDGAVGQSSRVTITVTSQGDGSKEVFADLTTEVEWLIYVPLVVRSYP